MVKGKAPIFSGLFLSAVSSIAVGGELLCHANLLEWRGVCGFWGLTGDFGFTGWRGHGGKDAIACHGRMTSFDGS